jgi:chromosomal replication initiator protein
MLARTIIRETAEKYGLTVGNLTGPSRVIEVCAARFEAMYRIRKELGQSLPTIGRLFGGRDHTTVMAAIHRHEARLARAAEGEEAE